jgi:hypothetical protein
MNEEKVMTEEPCKQICSVLDRSYPRFLYYIVACRPISRKQLGTKHVFMQVDCWRQTQCETHFRVNEYPTNISMDTSKQQTLPRIPLRYIHGRSDKYLIHKS